MRHDSVRRLLFISLASQLLAVTCISIGWSAGLAESAVSWGNQHRQLSLIMPGLFVAVQSFVFVVGLRTRLRRTCEIEFSFLLHLLGFAFYLIASVAVLELFRTQATAPGSISRTVFARDVLTFVGALGGIALGCSLNVTGLACMLRAARVISNTMRYVYYLFGIAYLAFPILALINAAYGSLGFTLVHHSFNRVSVPLSRWPCSF
jgi:hypothetical protein